MKLRGFKLLLGAVLISCTMLTGPAWAGSITFDGFSPGGQGTLKFKAGTGDRLTVGAGGGGLGALISQLFTFSGACSPNCSVTNGYLILTTGGQTSSVGGVYTFGSAGSSIEIFGDLPGMGNTPEVLLQATFNSETLFGGDFHGLLNLSSILLNPAIGTFTYNSGSSDAITFNLMGSCNASGCHGLVNNADVVLTTTPEPASLGLLGTGLLAVGCVLRKKLLS